MGFDPKIAEQLKFTIDDLEANKLGNLSPAQKRKLNRDAYIAGTITILFAVFFVVIGLVATVVESPLGLIVVVVGLLLGRFSWWYMRLTLNAKHVQSYTGRVKSVGVLNRAGNIIYTDQHNFHIAYRTFLVPNLLTKTFTFYFVAPQVLLSVEEVTETNSIPHQAVQASASNASQD